MSGQRRRSRAFSLVEVIVVMGIVAIVALGVAPALHRAATTSQSSRQRDVALRIARNVLLRVRAATAYDTGAVTFLASAAPASWTLPIYDPRTGQRLPASVTTSASGGVLSVAVSFAGQRVSLGEPLRSQAPPPGATLDPNGY